MRRVGFWAIALISLLFVVSESFLRKAIAVSLCGILSFNSFACTVSLTESSRANAALPSVENISTANVVYGIEPSKTTNFNPIRNQLKTVQSDSNTTGFFIPAFRELSPDKFELDLVTVEGCKFTTTIRKRDGRIYQESLRFNPSSLEVCKIGAFNAQLQPDGNRIEIEVNEPRTSLILEKIGSDSIKRTYKSSTGQILTDTVPIPERFKEILEASSRAKSLRNKGGDETKVVEGLCRIAKFGCDALSIVSGVGALAALNPATAAAAAAFVAPAATAGALTALIGNAVCFAMFGGVPPVFSAAGNLPGNLIKAGTTLAEVVDSIAKGLDFASGVEFPALNAANKTDFTFGFDPKLEPFKTLREKIGCEPKPKQLTKGTSYGDPHMITFDGFKYSFQTVGEFTLVKSTNGNFEVQSRQGAISNSVSMNTAVAMKIGNSRVALYAKNPPDSDTSTPLRVDGKPTKLENGTLELPGGGKIQGNSSYYLVTAPTGEQVGINLGNRRMDIKPYISAQSAQYIGLLGNANGNPADDLQTRNGKVIPTKENSTYGQVSQALRNVLPVPAPLNQAEKIFFDVVYKEFGDSWRISQTESLFDYPPGKDTGTFTNRSFPNSYLSLNSLLPPQIRQAEEICRKAGVESELMDGCIFDVGQTGDASFAQSAANALLDTAKDRLLQELGNKIPVPLPVPVRIPRIRF